jgi:anti-sigma-K factor RskA
VTPVAAGTAQAKSLELWLIEGDKSPVPLGVLPDTGDGEIIIPPDMRGRLKDGVTLAVSIEPFGGSPTGKPTGPVVAAGKIGV